MSEHGRSRRAVSFFSWSGERLSLLNDVIDEKPDFFRSGRSTSVRSIRRHLERLAGLIAARRLPFDRQTVDCSFPHVRGFDAGMRMARDRIARVDGYIHENRLVTLRRPIGA